MGATQTEDGKSYATNGSDIIIETPSLIQSGGGGGYYRGGSGGHAGAGGGSSFISGHNGCNAKNKNGIHRNNATHYSGLVFNYTVMIDGAGYKWTNTRATTATNDMPKPTGSGTQTGNIGNGYAKISW